MRFITPWVLLGFIAFAFASPSRAQTVPTNCKPNAGGTQECASEFPGPYKYLPLTCGAPYVDSESAANAVWEAAFLPTIQQCPGSIYNDIGWVPASAPMCSNGNCGPYPVFSVACGGSPSRVPVQANGIETQNTRVKSVDYWTPAPSCGVHHTPYFWGAVNRVRTTTCPRGYERFSGYCFRSSNTIDLAKGLGGQCPTCGNPIVPGMANKYQREIDYAGSGSSPLKFERFYNSLLRLADRDNGSYTSVDYFDQFGNEGFRKVGVTQARTVQSLPVGSTDRLDGMFWANVGLDAVGANWRHTYQRAVRYVQSTSISIAYAYRQDGRVLNFVQSGTSFYGHDDINDRLIRTANGGWQFTTGDTQDIEVYNADGRLESITSRTGIAQTLSYDSDGRLIGVVDSFGNALTFGYAAATGSANAENRIVSMTDPAGQVYQYGYGTNATLTSVTYPDLNLRQYQYGDATYKRALTAIIDESGIQFASFGYNANGFPTSSTHAGGADSVSVSYTKSGETLLGNATVTDAFGVARTHTYVKVASLPRISSVPSQPFARCAVAVIT